jgi:hypothetical protein
MRRIPRHTNIGTITRKTRPENSPTPKANY